MGAAALPVAVGMQVAGTAYGAYSAEQAGIAQQGYYSYLASQSRSEADLTDAAGVRQAHGIQDAAFRNYSQLKRGQAQLTGAQVAAEAATGSGGSATAEDIARDSAHKGLLDEMAIRYNADTQADETLRQAGLTSFNLRSQADSYDIAGTQARLTAKRQEFATILGGAASVAGDFPARPSSVPPSPAGGGSSFGYSPAGTRGSTSLYGNPVRLGVPRPY